MFSAEFISYLDWIAYGIGLIGSIVWALGWSYKGIKPEAYLWLISAIFWLYYAYLTKQDGLFSRDFTSIFFSVLAIMTQIKERKKVKH